MKQRCNNKNNKHYKELLSQILDDPDMLVKALQMQEGNPMKQAAMDVMRNITTMQSAQQPASLIGAK